MEDNVSCLSTANIMYQALNVMDFIHCGAKVMLFRETVTMKREKSEINVCFSAMGQRRGACRHCAMACSASPLTVLMSCSCHSCCVRLIVLLHPLRRCS